jgi:hypothetical protein
VDAAVENKSSSNTDFEGYPFPETANALVVTAVGWDIGDTGDGDVGVDKATDGMTPAGLEGAIPVLPPFQSFEMLAFERLGPAKPCCG